MLNFDKNLTRVLQLMCIKMILLFIRVKMIYSIFIHNYLYDIPCIYIFYESTWSWTNVSFCEYLERKTIEELEEVEIAPI